MEIARRRLGVAGAAYALTFRRGAGVVGVVAMGLGLVSGVYFPLDLLPDWIASIAQYNPIALAITSMREVLVGGSGWNAVGSDVALLALMSVFSLVLGLGAFRLAMRRERRLGTLGLY